MPIIIDANCIANVFDVNCARHAEFTPVRDWIVSGKGKMVYGGTTYENELRLLPKYLPIIRFLRESNKVIRGDKTAIDQYQSQVESKRTDPDFDDPHLVAISVVTKCLLICSEDTRSIKHVKDRKYYPKSFGNLPSYYTSSSNSNLLSDIYVHQTFKPLTTINRSVQDKFNLIKIKSK